MWAEASYPSLGTAAGREPDVRPVVLSYSVMHSGTIFLTRLIASAGFRVQHNHAHGDVKNSTPHGHGANSIFQSEWSDRPLVVPVRHPYDVVETWWQRDRDVLQLANCYRELLAHQSKLNCLEFFVSAKTEGERLHQIQQLSDHLGLPEIPGDWLEAALIWRREASQPHDKPPYPGDKSFVDFAVEHYGF